MKKAGLNEDRLSTTLHNALQKSAASNISGGIDDGKKMAK